MMGFAIYMYHTIFIHNNKFQFDTGKNTGGITTHLSFSYDWSNSRIDIFCTIRQPLMNMFL